MLAISGSSESNTDRLHQLVYNVCWQTVRNLYNRPGYRLLAQDVFLSKLLAIVVEDIKKSDLTDEGSGLSKYISKAALRLYSQEIYAGIFDSDADTQRQAFSELSAYIYRIAYNVILSRNCEIGMAEVCMQESLLQIFQYAKNVKKPDAFLAYVIKVTNSQCRRVMATNDRDFQQNPIDELPESPSYSVDSVEHLLTRDCLKWALSKLSGGQSEVLLLQYFAGFDDSQIAEELKTTVDNVQVRRHRALKQLRGLIASGCR